LIAQVLFVEHIERGAVFTRKLDGVAAADREMSAVVDSGGRGQNPLQSQGG